MVSPHAAEANFLAQTTRRRTEGCQRGSIRRLKPASHRERAPGEGFPRARFGARMSLRGGIGAAMIAARSPRASFDDERRDDARQPNDGSTRADGGAVPPPSPTRGAGHAGEATTSSSALGKMQVPWQKMKHGVKDITRKLAALKAPAVLDKFKPSSPPFNRPNPSSEGWVGAPAPPPTRPTAPGATVSWTLGAWCLNPNAPFGEQSDPPEGYVPASGSNFSRWQKRWLVATTPGVLVVYKRANRLGGPVGFVDLAHASVMVADVGNPRQFLVVTGSRMFMSSVRQKGLDGGPVPEGVRRGVLRRGGARARSTVAVRVSREGGGGGTAGPLIPAEVKSAERRRQRLSRN